MGVMKSARDEPGAMSEAAARKERREQRRRALGVDCVDRLVWKEWEPGKEYTRKILVKNIDRGSQTIQFALPTNRKTFITPFPEPITLSSGVAHEISISFRPTEPLELRDSITITVEGRGSFQVHLDCLTPYAKLSLPSTHDFGYCAIGTTAHAQLQVRNTGTAPVDFSWEVPAPFCILPTHAMLDEGETMHITLLFTPTEACTMVGQAVCRLTGTDDTIASFKVSGIGKHPYICFQEPCAAEGLLVVQMEAQQNSAGNGCTKTVHLCNPSPVAVSVRIRRVDESLLSAFRVEAPGQPPATAVAATTSAAAGPAFAAGELGDEGTFVVPRSAVQPICITYTPGAPGVIHFNTFQIECMQGNTLQMELSATTVGPRVTASTSSLDYGAVNLEQLPPAKQRTRHVTLQNTTATDAPFTWVSTSPGAAFTVEPSTGVVAAQSSVQVAVTFQPTHPILYYRRLHLLVEGAADVIGVDVLGGAYTSVTRPPTLTLLDVDAARLRAERGLGLLTPDELAKVAEAAAAAAQEEVLDGWQAHGQHGVRPDAVPVPTVEVWRRVEEEVRSPGVVLHGSKRKVRLPLGTLETANGAVAIDTPFGIDAKALYVFGGGSSGGASGESRAQLVTVMNTSTAPAIATWSVPPSQTCPYAVAPAQQLVPPHGSAVFQLHFSGGAGDGQPAACTLECYVNYESMTAFYLAPDGCVLPPQCFAVTCTSASLTATAAAKQKLAASRSSMQQPQSQQHGGGAGQIRMPRQVSLPACRLGGASYQVIALHNKGPAPVRYEVGGVMLKQVSAVEMPAGTVALEPDSATYAALAAARAAKVDASDSSEAVFSVYPTAGVVPARGRQLLVLKFNPRETAQYAATASLLWNGGAPSAAGSAAAGGNAGPSSGAGGDTTYLSLLGEVCLPQLQWRLAGEDAAAPLDMIAFPPSCVTGEAQQRAWMRNPTALPVEFHFDTSAALLGVLRMEPEWGIVPGGARLPVTLFFSPQQPRVFDGYLQLYVQDGAAADAAGDGGDLVQYRQQLRVRGEGVHADVEVEPRIIDVGEAADTREQQTSLTLYNSGFCDVQYDVRTMLLPASKPGASPTVVVPRLHNSRGVLPARTHTTVLIAAQPAPGLTEFVVYAVVSGLATRIADVPDAPTLEEAERHPHCRWRLRAAHPAVQVVDVAFPGVARPLAWQQLSLNAINAQLATAATEPLDTGNGADAFSFQHYVSGLDPISVDLGVAHEGDAAVVVTLTFKNTGDCAAPFDVMLPTQHEANTEHWCLENTELADLHYILDHGLVTIAPQQGSIDVGQTAQLEVRYVHDEIGVHRLPVLLRVGRGGRRVAVVLEGRTLPAEVLALNFHHEKVYTLMPVALGDMEPPLQFVTATNPFDDPVDYTVDLEALQEHAREHYGFPVFQCADPQGTVPPHGTAHIGFYFRPLEAREYRVSVLLQTAQGEGYYVDLVGTGYHPRKAAKAAVVQWIHQSLMQVPAAPPPLAARASAAFLSDDVCTLGAVPYYTLSRRTCAVQLSADYATAVRFAWHADLPHRGDALAVVHPAEGVVQPGETQTFKVLFYAGSTSQVLERLLTCTVVPCGAAKEGEDARRGASGGRATSRRITATPRTGGNATGVVGRLGSSSEEAASLRLLLQARVMPPDDFEALHGSERLHDFFTPSAYNSHIDPTTAVTVGGDGGGGAGASPPPTDTTPTEARFVRGVMDELLRSVVAAPAVQGSFTTLCAPRHVTYANMKVLHAAKAGSNAAGALPRSGAGASAAAAPTVDHGKAAVAAEDLLEELLRGALADAVAAA